VPIAESAATRALVACPTASIGVEGRHVQAEGLFPQEIEDGVSYCGFNSPDSFGANAFLAVRPEGNLLVDSPRFAAPLVRAIEDRGGVRHVLLTHRDDVADAEFGRFAGLGVAPRLAAYIDRTLRLLHSVPASEELRAYMADGIADQAGWAGEVTDAWNAANYARGAWFNDSRVYYVVRSCRCR